MNERMNEGRTQGRMKKYGGRKEGIQEGSRFRLTPASWTEFMTAKTSTQ